MLSGVRGWDRILRTAARAMHAAPAAALSAHCRARDGAPLFRLLPPTILSSSSSAAAASILSTAAAAAVTHTYLWQARQDDIRQHLRIRLAVGAQRAVPADQRLLVVLRLAVAGEPDLARICHAALAHLFVVWRRGVRDGKAGRGAAAAAATATEGSQARERVGAAAAAAAGRDSCLQARQQLRERPAGDQAGSRNCLRGPGRQLLRSCAVPRSRQSRVRALLPAPRLCWPANLSPGIMHPGHGQTRLETAENTTSTHR